MDPTLQIILGLLTLLGVLGGVTIPSILNYRQNRKMREDQIKDREEQKAEAAEAKKALTALATGIDGAMSELKETIAARGLAEGQLKGAKAEQERVAGANPVPPSETGLVSPDGEPIPVHDAAVLEALNPKLDKLQDTIDEQK